MTKSKQENSSPWLSQAEQKEDRRRKREALLHASAAAFSKKGFHATSLSDVAASLGISKPTIYHYFPKKEDILYEVASEALEKIQVAIDKAKGADGIERLRHLLIVYAKSLTVDYGKCVVRTSDTHLSEDGRVKLAARKREIDVTIRRAIEDAIADGTVRDCDVRMATFVVTGALNWIAQWHQPDGRLSPEEVAQTCTDILLGGLENRGVEITPSAGSENGGR